MLFLMVLSSSVVSDLLKDKRCGHVVCRAEIVVPNRAHRWW